MKKKIPLLKYNDLKSEKGDKVGGRLQQFSGKGVMIKFQSVEKLLTISFLAFDL
jgi:hypothetical protein